jgi:hypothetical protein
MFKLKLKILYFSYTLLKWKSDLIVTHRKVIFSEIQGKIVVSLKNMFASDIQMYEGTSWNFCGNMKLSITTFKLLTITITSHYQSA